MHHITYEHYQQVAEKLLEAIGEAEFFNGTITVEEPPFEVSFRATLLIRRTPALDPTDCSKNATRIVDIIPVWWEHHLYDLTGGRLTDFDWHELRKFLT